MEKVKNIRKLKLSSLFFISLFAFFSFTSAASLTQAQIDAIINMLRVFGADSATVENVRAVLNGSDPSAVSSSQGSASYSGTNTSQSSLFCPNISRNLSLGSRGEDVSQLQLFLKKAGFYNYPEITGYYGRVTAEAVKKFQKARGIVSYGSASTTGFGAVGPKTRSEILNYCRNMKLVDDFYVTPKRGDLPLETVLSFSYTGANCTSFSIDWGDGTQPIVSTQKTELCDNYKVKKIARHFYKNKGKYTITLRVSRGGKNEFYTEQVEAGVKPQAGNFDISPSSGKAPLVVGVTFVSGADSCSSYKIDWGDGTVDEKKGVGANCNPLFKVFAKTHTYQSPGSYNFKLYVGIGDTLKLVESRYIEVQEKEVAASGDSSAKQITASVEPTSGKAPLQVKVKIKSSNTSCLSYKIDWGDNTSAVEKESLNCNSSEQGGFDREFMHTYFTPGVYYLKLKLGQGYLNTLSEDVYSILVTQ